MGKDGTSTGNPPIYITEFPLYLTHSDRHDRPHFISDRILSCFGRYAVERLSSPARLIGARIGTCISDTGMNTTCEIGSSGEAGVPSPLPIIRCINGF